MKLLAIRVEKPVERYPVVPRPMILDVSALFNADVETKLAKLAVLTNPPGITAATVALDIYPAVPRPITVDVSALFNADVETKLAKFAVDTKLAKLAVLTNPPGSTAVPVALEIYPAVPRPMTVDVN